MDYDAYIDMVADKLSVDALNTKEIKIVEGCFERKWEVSIAADLVRAHWMEEEDYNMHGNFD